MPSSPKVERFRQRYGPWALVAGASEGLGAAWARGIAARGLNVAVVARRERELTDLARSIEAESHVQVRPMVEDLAQADSPERLFEACKDVEIGLLVYNAALSPIGPFLDKSLPELRKAIAINCLAPLGCAWIFGNAMKQRHRGGLILMSSLAGFQGSALVATYAATKAFNLVLAEGLWYELREHGVDVLADCAGATLTPGYVSSKPVKTSPFAPAAMAPEAVVEDGLDALGRKPSTIPGFGNRMAGFFMHRLATRRAAVSTISSATCAMYERDSGSEKAG